MGKVLEPDSPAVPSCLAGCAFYHGGGQEDAVESSQASTAAQLMGKTFGHLDTEQPGKRLKLQVSFHPRQPPRLWK